MSTPDQARHRRLRTVVLAAALVTIVFGSAFAVYDSLRSARARREMAAQTITSYAQFATYLYSTRAYLMARDRINFAFAPLNIVDPSTREALPPVTVLHARPDTSDKCWYPASDSSANRKPWPVYRLRLDLPSRRIQFAGPPPPPAVVAMLRDTLAKLATTRLVRLWQFGYTFLETPNGHEGVAFAPVYDAAKQPIAVYGYRTCYIVRDTTDLALLYRIVKVLPPMLIEGVPADSVLTLRVSDDAGHVLFEAPRDAHHVRMPGGMYLAAFGPTRWQVLLRPGIANKLVYGGIPESRVPAAAVLLILSIVLAIAAFGLFRSEIRLVGLRESFIANVSHELRTPLQQILMFVQLLRLRRDRSAAERERSLEIIEAETHRLIALAENVLAYSNPSPRPLRCEIVQVAQAAREAVALFMPLADARQITLELDVQPARARGDASAVRQMLINILDNAAKYGPVGQTVVVATTAKGECVQISVDDAGPGIPLADRERVWAPFIRLHRNVEESTGGAGIGLAIVRDLVTRMGGGVGIEDSPVGGARIVICLPRAEESSQ